MGKSRKKANSRQIVRRKSPKRKEITCVNPNAAGIDIGSKSHFVAVPEDRDEHPIREFGCFTAELNRLADWLEECGIETVAMESTGVYWIAVFQILEARGFEVKLVNAHHVKNVPGRKSDVQDCRWIQQLHTYGLLSGSFRPDDQICVLRSYIRQRDNLVKACSPHIQRMQKSLTQMNIQLHRVITDIKGASGLRIIEAIVAGERDPKVLAAMSDPRIKRKKDEIALSLEGDYREEHIFSLRQELELYKIYRTKIEECERQIHSYLRKFDDQIDPDNISIGLPRGKNKHSELREQLYRISGVDFTKIDGMDVLIVQTIISEVGLNANKWPTEKNFCSWLGICPNNKITGGQVKSSKTRHVVNRAAQAFRMAAQAAGRSKSALGAYYRRMKARLGAPQAITATAHKLARIFYRLLKYGEEYVDPGMNYYERKYQNRVFKNLAKRAEELGYELVKKQAVTEGVS